MNTQTSTSDTPTMTPERYQAIINAAHQDRAEAIAKTFSAAKTGLVRAFHTITHSRAKTC